MMKTHSPVAILMLMAAVLLCLCSVVLADSSTEAPAQVQAERPAVLTKEQVSKSEEAGNSETRKFDSDVNKMMKLIINSLYKTKEIFLRELISNGSDALDKIRFLSLTNPEALKDQPELKLSVYADKESKTLSITDTGVGMTKEQLVQNLGVIAKSGTSEFLKEAENGTASDMGLIGQFGVGFYSVFLVADSVVVVSKHNDDKQYIWESNSESDYTISEDIRGNTLGRGTQIIVHLKDDALEYLEESRIKELIQRYSEFINFPIYLWTSSEVTEEIPDPDAEEDEEPVKEATSSDDEDDAVEDLEDEDIDKKEKKPKTKTVTKTVEEWSRMNEMKPIWTRSPKDITDKEYNDFYKAFSRKSHAEPLSWTHFHAEGEMDFRSLLYIPERPSPGFLQKMDTSVQNIKLFVRRVFITDDLKDFLPRYLTFLIGLVDSDDLPLNVSRETLQHSVMLRLIQKKVIGKALEMIKNLQKDEAKWEKFVREYNTALKLGVIEDSKNKKKLSKLIRFPSSHGDGMYGLEEYISRMKGGQPQIYVCTGSDLDEVKRSPFTEKLIGRGYEVLFLAEPIDEYVISSLQEFGGKKIQSIAKAGLLYGDESEADEKIEEGIVEKFKPLTDFLQKTLESNLAKVVISNKLTKSPCAVVASEHGVSGTMEKLMQAQALGSDDPMSKHYLNQKKILEINPAHPIMEGLLARVEKDAEDPVNEETVRVLYESTLLVSGYALPNTIDFAKRIEKVIRSFVGVDLEKEAVVDLKPAPEKAEEEEVAPESEDDEEDDDEDKPEGMPDFDFEDLKMPEPQEEEDLGEIHDEL